MCDVKRLPYSRADKQFFVAHPAYVVIRDSCFAFARTAESESSRDAIVRRISLLSFFVEAFPQRQMKFYWLNTLLSGLLVGAISVVASVSLAAMVFSGPLSAELAYGVQIALLTASIAGSILAVGSSSRVVIAIPQDRIAPVMALMAAGIVTTAPGGTSPQAMLATVAIVIAATTVLTGACLLFLGLTRAGGLMRFIPYSVIGGFFAGTGWLLIVGGLRIMMGNRPHSADGVVSLLTFDAVTHWLPGVALAVIIFAWSRFVSSGIALTLAALIGGALFFAISLTSGATLETLSANGWLLGPLQSNNVGFWRMSLTGLFSMENLDSYLTQWPDVSTVVAISAISIMLTVSALEMSLRKNVDINRELSVAGVANVATGFFGGMVAFHSLSMSTLSIKLGVKNRIVGLLAAAFAAFTLFYGVDIVALMPRMVAGAVLFFIGLSFVSEWLIGSWKKLPHGEYFVIPLILLAIATAGFMEGLFVGLVAAFIQFLLRYSRTSIIRQTLYGNTAKSSVERSIEEERYLAGQGNRLLILKLRGYLFFGTTTQLSNRVQLRVDDDSLGPLDYVLLDLRAVNGIDSSAAYEFQRLDILAQQFDFTLILTGMNRTLSRQLITNSKAFEPSQQVQTFIDFDHGMEWYEERILSSSPYTGSTPPRTALELLSDQLGDQQAVSALQQYLRQHCYAAGDYMIRQGEQSDILMFLESGCVSVYLASRDGSATRIRRTGAGTILGELGFYLKCSRSASVVADCPTEVYQISSKALAEMESAHPDLATGFHRFMANLMAERLLRTTAAFSHELD